MAPINAGRQRGWRKGLRSKPYGNKAANVDPEALTAHVAELEATPVGAPPAASRIRLLDELPRDSELPDDWSGDEEIADFFIGQLKGEDRMLGSGKVEPVVLILADLLERAGTQFIDACRRQAAIDEQRATEARMNGKGKKRR